MKHPTLLLLSLAAASAAAQTSNVSLYGVLDVGVAHNTHVGSGSLTVLATRHESSFWGIRGREDLGGGHAALFQFERSIAVDSGADGVRSSFVGLQGPWGTVTAGRQYDLMVDHVQTDPARQHSINAVVPGNYDRSLGNYLNNSIKYKSPALGHVVLGAMYAVDEPGEASPTNLGHAVGINAVYNQGPLRLAATALKVKGVSARPFNDLGVASLYGETFAGNPGKSIVHDQNILALGGYYDIAGWRALGNFTHTSLKAANGRKETYRALRFGAFTPVRQGIKIGVGASIATLVDSRWVTPHAILTYVFSPRSEIYLRAVTQRASGPNQRAAIFLEGPASGTRQSVIGAGLTHRF